MSENTDSRVDETEQRVREKRQAVREPTELPSKDEIEQQFKNRLDELEQRGVTRQLECSPCGETVTDRVLPEDTFDKTLCWDCAEAYLRTTDLI